MFPPFGLSLIHIYLLPCCFLDMRLVCIVFCYYFVKMEVVTCPKDWVEWQYVKKKNLSVTVCWTRLNTCFNYRNKMAAKGHWVPNRLSSKNQNWFVWFIVWFLIGVMVRKKVDKDIWKQMTWFVNGRMFVGRLLRYNI